MIADIIDNKLHIRLITRNIMSVYSTDSEYVGKFIRKLKHSKYIVNNDKTVNSDDIISYVKRTYNTHENIYRFVRRHSDIDTNKFIEYLNFIDLHHLLWLHFYQLSEQNLSIIEILLQLSTNKPIVIVDYIDGLKHKDKLYTLLFHVGLENRLIIVPFNDIDEAVNNSTCQCYIKSEDSVTVCSKFPNEYIEKEFNTSPHVYYTGLKPLLYRRSSYIIKPTSYTYTITEIVLIILFSLKMLLITFNNWRTKVNGT